MEIFRTDGSGRTYSDERLFRLIKNVELFTEKNFFDCIDVINDHKGTLNVHFNKKLNDFYLNYYFSVFMVFWYFENEFLIEFYYKRKLIKQ